ncbi:hypothetical protein [Pseudomonas sp. A014]|uniref:hypothetical protein n=1 Tax=Pseudomonas sp. A014 TaxID=3458058 RepID=UPI0040375824
MGSKHAKEHSLHALCCTFILWGWFAALPFLNAPLESLMPQASGTLSTSDSKRSKCPIRGAFNRWRNAQEGVFDLLAPKAHWMIADTSLTFGGTRRGLAKVIVLINARVSRPVSPSMRQIPAASTHLVELLDGETVANDGRPSVDNYARFMRLENGVINNAMAFFDAKTLGALPPSVQPSR